MDSRSLLACLVASLVTALFASCSTVSSREPASSEALYYRPFGGENGGVRGGGDTDAGLFMALEPIVLEKLRQWKRLGKITLPDEDLAKIERFVNGLQSKPPSHWVVSEEKVCLQGGKKPNGDCNDPLQERAAVKVFDSKPPQIILGRKIWRGLSPMEREVLVEHEIRGLALSRLGKPFVDEAFDQSYRTAFAAQGAWEEAKYAHLSFVLRMKTIDSLYLMADLSAFQTVADTLALSSDDYKSCVKYPSKEWDDRKTAEVLYVRCNRALDQWGEALQKYATPSVQKQVEKVNVQARKLYEEYEAWIGTLPDPRWKEWFTRRAEDWIQRRNKIIATGMNAQSYDTVKDPLTVIMDEKCPRSRTPEPWNAVRCNFEKGSEVAVMYFEKIMGAYVQKLIVEHEKIFKEGGLQISPP